MVVDAEYTPGRITAAWEDAFIFSGNIILQILAFLNLFRAGLSEPIGKRSVAGQLQTGHRFN